MASKSKNQARQSDETLIMERVKNLINLIPDQVTEKGAWSNPMRGHKSELLFTRITGHPDAKDAHHWVDSSECWICQKWSKVEFKVCANDAVLDKDFEEIIILSSIINGGKKREDENSQGQKGKLQPLEEENTTDSSLEGNSDEEERE